MAEKESSLHSKDFQTPVVLRVKRKREDDPVEALAIQLKRGRLEGSTVQLDEYRKEVFQLCGTLPAKSSADDSSVLELIKHFKDRRDLVKPNPLARLSLSDQQEQCRAERKIQSAHRRYKLVSELRSVDVESTSASTASDRNDGATEWLHHIDIELDEHPSDNAAREQSSSSTSEFASKETITCNSTVMVREKLEPCEKEDKTGYLYDFYYVGSQDISQLDWTTLSAHTNEVELVHDIIDSSDDERYDDEDDSNEETNWRNDYPDEDYENESCDSSQSEDLDHSCFSYRHKYQYDEFEPYYPDQYCGELDSEDEDET